MTKGRKILIVLTLILGTGIAGFTPKAEAGCNYDSWSDYANVTARGYSEYTICDTIHWGTIYYGFAYMSNCSVFGCFKSQVDGIPINGDKCHFVDECVAMEYSTYDYQTGRTSGGQRPKSMTSETCNNPVVSYSVSWPRVIYRVRCALGVLD